MGNLGCQAQRSTPEAIAFAQRSPIVKGVSNVDILTKAPDSAIRIFRWVFDHQGLSDPETAYSMIVSALRGYRHPNLYTEVYNELPKESLYAYIEFLERIVPMLHAAGLKVCGPSWATGDYEQEDWNAFRQAGWCGLDAINLHGYWASRGFSQWNALRWRTYYDPALDHHLPVFISECGRDRVRDGENASMVGNGGWKADGLSAEAYAAELNAYGAQLLPHEYALPFVSGPESTWLNYSVDPVSAMLKTTPPKPLPDPGGNTVPEQELHDTFADLWKRASGGKVPYVTGQAITDKWTELAKQGDFLGTPTGPTQDTKNGIYRFQMFQAGVLSCKIGEWKVTKGLPPLA